MMEHSPLLQGYLEKYILFLSKCHLKEKKIMIQACQNISYSMERAQISWQHSRANP